MKLWPGIVLILLWLVAGAQKAEQDSAQRQFSLATTDSARVFWLGQISFAYRNSNPDTALQLGMQALAMAQKLQQKVLLADCHNSIAVAYRKKGEYSRSLQHFMLSLRMRESLGDSQAMAVTYGNIATVYNNLKKYKESLPFFEKALHIFISQGNAVKAGAIYNNMGVSYEHTGDLDKALQAYMRSLDMLKQLHDTANMPARYNNIGIIYEKQKKFTEALQYQQAALSIQEKFGDNFGASISAYNLGNVYNKIVNYPEAIRYLKKSVALSKALGDMEGMQMSNHALADVYKNQGNYKEAMPYFELQAIYKDSLFNLDKQKQVAELQTRYETEKKEQSISLLSKEQQVQESSLRKKATIQRVVMTGLAIVLVLLAFLYRLYLQKREANARLVQLDRDKNEFLGIAAHDLRNPLQAIIGYCQLQAGYFDKLDKEKILKYTGNIDLSARRMVELINNLLDINAIEEGRVRNNPERIDLDDFFNNLMKDFDVLARQKSIRISLESEGSKYHIHSDPRLFSQVAENLLSNAIKYSPTGSSVKISLVKAPGKAGFEVSDSGPGFTEQDRQQLFGKFARLSAKPTAGESSVGLGLSIVKKLCDMMQADVQFNSRPGAGTTFRVIFNSPEVA